ncbi:MAG TPA: DUF1577 domain-containing protein [Spirochaetes bacterium]|nr:DUF1577 domain-containing protein [Spirochaetota bacterium]
MKYNGLNLYDRNFTEVTEEKQVAYLVEQYLDKKKVYIKGLDQKITAEIEVLYPNPIARLRFSSPLPNGLLSDEITIFTVTKRYIEITLRKSHCDEIGGEFELMSAKIAKSFREDPRVSVLDEDFIAENFRLSKYAINPNIEKVPICVQIAFDTVVPKLMEEFPECTASVLDTGVFKKDTRVALKQQKPLYIEDVLDEATFSPLNPELVDYRMFLGPKLQQEIEQLKKENIKSFLVYPVVYTNLKDEKASVGYFKMASKSKVIPEAVISRLDEFSKELNSIIRDANIKIIKDPIPVTNISKKGIQISVQDQTIIDTFHLNRSELVLTVRPLATYRFTLYAKIVNIIQQMDGSYTIGMRLIGGEENRGMSAWQKYFDRFLSRQESSINFL